MAVFFTSDTHFGHAAILHMCERPFGSVEEMDETLISNWNAAVAPGDTVYHLGDFCYRSSRAAPDYLARLNGTVHLVAGNHDGQTLKAHAGAFASVSLIKEVVIGRQALVLCHYPMREWHGCYRGAWHLFGHVHGRLNHEPLGHSLDVGVDSNDFRPLSLDELAELFAGRPQHFGTKRAKPVRRTTRAPSPGENP